MKKFILFLLLYLLLVILITSVNVLFLQKSWNTADIVIESTLLSYIVLNYIKTDYETI
jgi:hypothetical protein